MCRDGLTDPTSPAQRRRFLAATRRAGMEKPACSWLSACAFVVHHHCSKRRQPRHTLGDSSCDPSPPLRWLVGDNGWLLFHA